MHHQNIAAGGVASGVVEGVVEGVLCLEGDLVLILDSDLVLILGLEAPAGLDSSPCLLAVIEEGWSWIRGGGGSVIRTLRVLVSA